MKKINFNNHKIVKAGLMVALIAFISSCDWIDPDMNIDPDRPQNVPMNLLVPGIQQTIGFALMGNSSVRTVDMWVQIFDGVSRQSFTEARYSLTPADANDLWENAYTQILINAKILEEKAIEEESPHNQGLAKVMTAYSLGILTDLFGDIPYTEALDGTENVLKPAFDAQQQVYSSIFTLLDDGIGLLSQAEDPVGIGGDVIYGGSAGAWVKAARAIKARAELQLSKKNGATAYNNALALVDAFSSNADDMMVPWENANNNPIYLFMQDRTDIRMAQTLLDELSANNDPRIPFFFAPDDEGGISGSIPGSQNEAASGPGEFIAGQTAPSILMSYAELKFIEAEAAFETGDKERAATAYIEGVAASLEKVTGEVDADWMADNIEFENAGSITLEKIIMQKRFATVGQVQPYSDWRRTGIPSLDLISGATTTEIPRRFPYAQSEIIYNEENIPAVGSLIVPVWWDE